MNKIKKYKPFLESLATNEPIKQHEPDLFKILPKEVKDLHKLFKRNVKKIWLVGGAVRDFLVKTEPKDFDIVTDSLPDETIEIIKQSDDFNLTADGTVGKRFGVVIVKHKEVGDSMEVATLRVDITKGRNTKVRLGVSLEEDAQRRDLRINALYYDLDTKEIIDYVGGIDAVKNKMATFVGRIEDRIQEDPIRILRFARFLASMGGKPTKEEIDAIRKNNKLEMLLDGEIQRVSQEAIWVEFEKAWKKAKDFTQYLKFLTEFDMWEEMFPGITINTDFKITTDFNVMLANLFSKTRKKNLSKFMVEKLKIPSKFADVTQFLLELPKYKEEDILLFLSKLKRFHLDKGTISEFFRVMDIDKKHLWAFLKFNRSVSAQDLMKQGFKGSQLGAEIEKQEIEKFKKLL